jgi:hypothetical protein
MKIDDNEIRGIIAESIESVTGQFNWIDLHSPLEHLGITDQSNEIHFKQTLLNRTIEFLTTNEGAVDLKEDELGQVIEELNFKVVVNRQDTGTSFERRFIEIINQALPGDVNKGKDPKR